MTEHLKEAGSEVVSNPNRSLHLPLEKVKSAKIMEEDQEWKSSQNGRSSQNGDEILFSIELESCEELTRASLLSTVALICFLAGSCIFELTFFASWLDYEDCATEKTRLQVIIMHIVIIVVLVVAFLIEKFVDEKYSLIPFAVRSLSVLLFIGHFSVFGTSFLNFLRFYVWASVRLMAIGISVLCRTKIGYLILSNAIITICCVISMIAVLENGNIFIVFTEALPTATVITLCCVYVLVQEAQAVQEREAKQIMYHAQTKRSRILINNILPRFVINRIARGERTFVSQPVDTVVMFLKIHNFEETVRHLSSVQVMALVSGSYEVMDQLVQSTPGVTKIENVLLDYMVASEPAALESQQLGERGLKNLLFSTFFWS